MFDGTCSDNMLSKSNFLPILFNQLTYWRQGLKPPPACEDSPKNRRPICLLNGVGNIYEKDVLKIINYYVFANNLVREEQFGFMRLTECISFGRDRKYSTLGPFWT